MTDTTDTRAMGSDTMGANDTDADVISTEAIETKATAADTTGTEVIMADPINTEATTAKTDAMLIDLTGIGNH